MTVGAGGALNVIFKTLLDPGDEVLIPAPYFVEYRFYVDNGGGVTRVIPTREDFSLDLGALEAGITERTKAVLINSPNNPTGKVYRPESLRALAEIESLRSVAADLNQDARGTLSIATTHTQARYVLPKPISELRSAYPKVNISLHQGSPEQVAQMLIDDVVDMGIATESLAQYDQLVTLPCYEWQHVLVMPKDHPLAKKTNIRLEDLALEPLITYHPSYTGRTKIDRAFESKKLHPRIALEAIDSDVIKTYVRTGLGIGIVAEMAVQADGNTSGNASGDSNQDLAVVNVGHLFGKNVTRVAFKRSGYLRNFVYTFAELLSERLSKAAIVSAMNGKATGENDDYAM